MESRGLKIISRTVEKQRQAPTCPGMKSFRIIGSPRINASAIVPGPARKCQE